MICDVTNEDALEELIEKGVQYFGGLDMVVLNAGMFPKGKKVSELPSHEWRNVFSVNLDANLNILRIVFPLLQAAPNNGTSGHYWLKKCFCSRTWSCCILSFKGSVKSTYASFIHGVGRVWYSLKYDSS